MPTPTLLPLPDGLEITAIGQTADGLLVRVVSTRTTCSCPVCHTPSGAVHRFYRRHPLELPCAGQHVQLVLSVHTFFCRVPTCPRKVFTERLPELLEPSSRLTTRLRALLQAIGVAFNGQGGARLGKQFGIQISRVTLLHALDLLPALKHSQVRAIGIDDASWRRTLVLDSRVRVGQHGRTPEGTPITPRAGHRARCSQFSPQHGNWLAEHCV